MTTEDYIALATFLGQQVQLLHSLPVTATLLRTTWAQKTTRLPGRGPSNGMELSGLVGNIFLVNGSAASDKLFGNEKNMQTGCIDADMKKVKGLHADVPSEWHYFVGLMRQQRVNALERFEDW